ncbi:MAG: 4-hydroxy-tetrahydrodipicolinate synthase [Candidatus Krumholzibacteriota bacterium]|nr:4-hydroxy-tetrahydrodipicolinate synthase [Candidatus Krumholzibacteriota bacterium]
MLKGLYIALVTPFKDNGSLNEEKLAELVKFHSSAGTDGLVPCATTSESPALSRDEQDRMIKIAVKHSSGRMKVVAGCGTNSTEGSIENIRRARSLGADAAMTASPYYNKPTQEGLYAHFRKLADEGGLPLMLYNVPGRTGVNIDPVTVERLCDHENIVAVKEASGDVEQVSEIIARCGERIDLLSGDDAITLPVLSAGGRGVVSVVGNIIPGLMLKLISLFNEGNQAEATELHLKLLPLCQAMFLETNPVPVKEAMNMIGKEIGGPRLPLVGLREENRIKLREVLTDFGLLGK